MDNTNENVPSNDYYLDDPHMNNIGKVTFFLFFCSSIAFTIFIIQEIHAVYKLKNIKNLLRTDVTEKIMNKDPDLLKRASFLLN